MTRCAFIIHSRTLEDLFRKFPWARRLPKRVVEHALAYVPPIIVSRISGRSKVGVPVEGWLLGCPMTARQILQHPRRARKQIGRAVALAQRLGAEIVGLGALTAPATKQGTDLLTNGGISITTGNTYTAAVTLEDLEYLAEATGQTLNEGTVAIVGATGSIGSACARHLSGRVRELVLVGRTLAHLEALVKSLPTGQPSMFTTAVDEIRRADFVLIMTSAAEAVVRAGDLKPGAIVYDITQPSNLPPDIARARPDVLFVEGGLVATPGIDYRFNFGLPPATAFGCLAETVCLALEGWRSHYTVGPVDITRIDEIRRKAERHGFRPAGFRSFGQPVKEDAFRRIRQIRAQRTPVCSEPTTLSLAPAWTCSSPGCLLAWQPACEHILECAEELEKKRL